MTSMGQAICEWERASRARRQRLVDLVRKIEAQLDLEYSSRRPIDYAYLAEDVLQFPCAIPAPVNGGQREIWRATWQLVYRRTAGKWRFAVGDEIVDLLDMGNALLAGEVPLTDAPNAPLLFFARRIGSYARDVRDELDQALEFIAGRST